MKLSSLAFVAGAFALATAVLPAADPTSANIPATLDSTCKPCEDFFKYVNQKWLTDNPIPAAYPRWGRFNELSEANRERLKTILDAAVEKNTAGHATADEARIANMYGSCMDVQGIEKRGLEPLKADLAAIEAINSPAALQKVIIRMYEVAAPSPIGMAAAPDQKNATQTILNIASGGLSLPERDYYFNTDARTEKIREEFLKHVARMHVLLGDSKEKADAEAKTIFDFEKQMAEATMTNVERRNPDNRYHKFTFAELQQLAPAVDWKAAFTKFAIPTDQPINVVEPKFFTMLNTAITTTSLDTWKTYLRWRLVRAHADSLPAAFDEEAFSFSGTVLTGVKEQLPRWKRCVTAVDRSLGDALGESFIKKYFPPAAKMRIDELIANMRATLADSLTNADWLSAETKTQALDKLSKITPKIGYPARWKDYSTVTIKKDRYIENQLAARDFERKRNLAKIGKPIDKNDWGMTPPTVNAYYNPLFNEIAFPAGILQPPFFDATADDSLNYGAIGAVIGHEIGHGFDDQGSKFDAVGNRRDWWTEDDRKKFDARATCIVDQFNSFEVQPGARHIGKLVTGEAMGDLGGLTLAYRAYHRSLKGKPAPVIDGLTGDQRFFIAFARVWGSHQRQQAELLQLKTDPHPLGKYRANETLKNMPEFMEAFKCQLGDAMTRPVDQRCKLW